MTIQKVTRAKPETEEVPSGLVGYIVVRRSMPDIHGRREWTITRSPFDSLPIYETAEQAIPVAEDSEYVIEITLPFVEE